ncbi:MAG: hypothetical protein AUJ56_12455 [Zetaproteobacteria bacterium CG1_02_49_23]|nr:MAG: hypothetical protein AUJ56_12455 [Zetaproteobacteria bacterium CG1_02_49_23]
MLRSLIVLMLISMTLPSCVATAVMGGAVAGSAAFDKRTMGQQMDDTTITSKVRTALVKEKDMPSRYISIDVLQGKVTLTGFLPTQEQIDRAEFIVKEVAGVLAVRNELRVGEPTAGNWMSDSWITTQIKSKLFGDGIASGVNVRVETVDGVVYLQGIVDSEDLRYKAVGIARAVDGVAEVKNLLEVQKQ